MSSAQSPDRSSTQPLSQSAWSEVRTTEAVPPTSLQDDLFNGMLGVLESVTAPNGAQDLLLVHLDPEGIIRYVTPSILFLTGYKAAEIVDRRWSELFGTLAENSFTYFDAESNLFKKDAIITEMVLVARDGSQRVMTWRIYRHPATHDRPGGAITMLGLDVTEQRKRLTQAKETGRRLDEQNRLLGSLHALSRQLGRSLNLQNIYRLMHKEIGQRFLGSPHLVVALVSEDRSHFVCDFAIVDDKEVDHTTFPKYAIGEGPTSDCFRTGEPQIVDIRALRTNLSPGRIIHVGEDSQVPNSGLYVPLNAGDTVIGVMNVQRYEINAFDETDLDLLAVLGGMAGAAIQNALLYRKLQEQANQMQTIMQSINHGLILIDCNWQVLLANPAAQSYLSILDGITPDGRLTKLGDVEIERLLEGCNGGIPKTLDLVSRSKPPHTFEVQGAAIGAKEDPSGWVMVIADVTDERQAQRYTQQQERLAAVGQLAAGIAHDFNNIMGAIVIYAQTLQMQTTDTGGRRRLDTIISQAKHASNLIRQILDFSRRSVLERMVVDLMPFIKELVQLLRRTLPENINLELSYDQNAFVIDADITRIQQALMNLAVNARDAMPNGGDLAIHLSHLVIDKNQPSPVPTMQLGHWLDFSITDTGTGIPPEVQDHIFEPFFTTKEVGAGTGLGLAQVYGIVQQHGGEIAVQSQVGEGTTFHLYFPLIDEPTQLVTPPALSRELSNPSEATILVVEDEAAMRAALEDILRLKGYKVILTANGKEALKVIETTPDVTLILTDLVMPVMGGEELRDAVHQLKPDMAILFMTGYAPPHSLAWVQQQPNRLQLIQKPFSADDILARIGEMLAS